MLSPFVVCGGLGQGEGGLGFGIVKAEQPHPAPVWPQLPLSRILILDYGYLPHLPKPLNNSLSLLFTRFMDGSSTSI